MFLNIIFPDKIGRSSKITSTFDTYIEQNGFFERRNVRYSYSRVYADLSFQLRRRDEILELKDIHDKAKGSGYSFKFEDFTYNSTNNNTREPTPVDFKIAQTTSELLSIKRLVDRNGKIIQLPQQESIFITFIVGNILKVYTDIIEDSNNIEYIESNLLDFFGSAYENNIEINFNHDILDYYSGNFKQSFLDEVESFEINEDVGIYSGFKFFLKMRFESDEFSIVADGYDSFQAPDCRLVEVFE